MAILDLDTYKDYQGINSDKQDTKITRTIDAVNSYIPSYCNRSFVDYFTTPKVEYFDATEPDYYPVEFPIVAVSSINYSALADADYLETLDEYTDYVIDMVNSRIVSIGSGGFISATTGINSGKITYTGGYETYPDEIIQAAVLMVEYFIDESYNYRKSLAGASVDSIIQPDMTSRLPPHIRRILEHYKAWSF